MSKPTASATWAEFDIPFWLARIEARIGRDGHACRAIPHEGVRPYGEFDAEVWGYGDSLHEAIVDAIRVGNGMAWVIEETD